MATNTIFSGSSRFSNDFSQIIDRSLRIASLPLGQLNNQKATLTAKQSAWSAVASKFADLRTALTGIASTTGSAGYFATSSDNSVAKANTTSGVMQGTYRIKVADI